MSVYTSCFDNILCAGKGTILYGTLVYINKQKFFNIENIYYSKGRTFIYFNQFQKLQEIYSIMKNHISQTAYTTHHLIFNTSIINTDYNKLLTNLNDILMTYMLFNIGYYLKTNHF